MRYLLLGTTIIAASAMLPMVDMSGKPTGQPVSPVDVSVLDAPLPSPTPLAVEMPSIGMSSFFPVRVLTEFLTPDSPGSDDASVDGDAPAVAVVTRASAEVPADLPPVRELPRRTGVTGTDGADIAAGVRATLEAETQTAIEALAEMEEYGIDTRGAADALRDIARFDVDAEEAMNALAALEAMGAGTEGAGIEIPGLTGLGDLPVTPPPALGALDLAPGGGPGLASLFPMTMLTNFFSGDEAEPAAPAATPRGPSDPVANLSPAPGSGIAPTDLPVTSLAPLAEDVGTMILGTQSEVSLTLTTFAPETGKVVAIAEPSAPKPAPAPEPAAETAGTTGMMEVTASYLNLRTGPGSNHAVVVGLARGAEAELIERAGNGWVRVRVSGTGQEGWAFSRYLAKSDA